MTISAVLFGVLTGSLAAQNTKPATDDVIVQPDRVLALRRPA